MSEKITMVPEAPGPWRIACKFGKWRIIDAEGYCVCVIGGSVGEMACGASKDVAEYIVLCVNEHCVRRMSNEVLNRVKDETEYEEEAQEKTCIHPDAG